MALGLMLLACGQKGPPLAPLHLVPGAPTEVAARRVADRVRIRFVLPTTNANGPGPVQIDRVEIYAITVPPGVTPTNRALMTKENIVGQIAVRPPLAEGEQPKEGDTRPDAGAAVFFDDPLTPEKLEPVVLKTEPPAPGTAPAQKGAVPAPTGAAPAPTGAPAPAGAAPAQTETAPAPTGTVPAPTSTVPVPTEDAPGQKETVPAPAGAAPAQTGTVPAPTGAAPGQKETVPTPTGAAPAPAAPAPAAASKDPIRVYVVRGITKSGRTGQQSVRAQITLHPLPPPPVGLAPRVTETAVVLEWKPAPDAAAGFAYNVYRAAEPMDPLNPAPLEATSFEYTAAQLGQEYCLQVRSVTGAAAGRTEGDLSDETCVTPQDVFPPAAPKKPDAVATAGQISLIWDANTEKDVSGYLVLRGEAPDDALRPLTPAPIRETSFRDTTVRAGVRYVYAIVAVDSSTPANASPESQRVEETAR